MIQGRPSHLSLIRSTLHLLRSSAPTSAVHASASWDHQLDDLRTTLGCDGGSLPGVVARLHASCKRWELQETLMQGPQNGSQIGAAVGKHVS